MQHQTYQHPTDEEMRRAPRAVQQWWARVYRLKHETGCSLEHAIRAVRAVDAEHPARTR